MKKVLLTFILLISAFTLTGCGGPKTYDEISYDELYKKIDAKENFILFIGSETCSACSSYKITINKITEKYHVDIKYIDISKLESNELNKLRVDFPFSGTPATVFITKGKEKNTYNRVNGNEKYSSVVKKLKENGYIKEK